MCMLSKQGDGEYQSSSKKSIMKQRIISMLAGATMMMGASAQGTERTKADVGGFFFGDSLKLDSMYNYWNDFVTQHPNDEIAWRNLFDVSESKVYQMLNQRMQHSESPRNLRAVEDYRKQLNVVGRMEKAIPGTYTFYYSAYMGSYKPEVPEGTDVTTLFMHTEAYADSAIAKLPDDSWADDYELWIQHLIPKRDTVRLTRLLTRYYESGQYPEEALQYHFNELQGMDEGAVYIAPNPGEIIGKLILQHVLGVHRDKILYDEDAAMDRDYVKDVFGHIGIPFDESVWNDQLHATMWQDKTLRAIMQYIFDHSKRPVYLSAHDMWLYTLGQGLSDELKACLYNEGLTMHYSAKPYDNRSVKRRNIEQRYRLEYLRMPFHPEIKNTQRFSGSTDGYAMNYLRLLRDQLLYYKQYKPERYQWLSDIFRDIISQLEKKNYDVDEFKDYLK